MTWYERLRSVLSLLCQSVKDADIQLSALTDLRSRVHALHTYPPRAHLFIKRDDELCRGIASGTKIRKYGSLIPHLIRHRECCLKQGIRPVVGVLGSYQSNNVLCAVQTLRELQMDGILYLRGESVPEHALTRGNWWSSHQFLLTDPAGEAKIQLRPFSRSAWAQKAQLLAEKECTFVIPEGGNSPASYLGALSLALDILRNEEELQLAFARIFVDAGTGLSAAALACGLALVEHPAKVHVVLVGGTDDDFHAILAQFELGLPVTLPRRPCVEVHQLQRHRSFGSVRKSGLGFIRRFASESGVLLDPIYSGKIFQFVLEDLLPNRRHQSEQGHTLLVHSGGVLSLAGFAPVTVER